jgi:hypothetical protein
MVVLDPLRIDQRHKRGFVESSDAGEIDVFDHCATAQLGGPQSSLHPTIFPLLYFSVNEQTKSLFETELAIVGVLSLFE